MKITIAKLETIEVDSLDDIPEGLYVVTSKEEAQQLAQQFLTKALPFIAQAERLADTFRFVLHRGDEVYLPKALTPEEKDYRGILGERINEYVDGGEWMSSSSYKSC